MFATACAPGADFSFEVHAVSPDSAPLAAAVKVRIEGAPFYTRATQVIGAEDGEPLSTYRAWLGEVELTEVRRLSLDALEATVPAELAVGTFPLRVENPYGATATLAEAFTVAAPVAPIEPVEPAPAALVAEIVAPAAVNVGQVFELRARVRNSGGRAARAVVPAALALSTANATVTAGPSPAEATIDGGATAEFLWTLTGAASGVVTAETSATGIDVGNDAPVASGPVQSGEILVQQRAALSGTMGATSPKVGDTFTVLMGLANTGEAAANNVAPSPLSCFGIGVVTQVGGPTPAEQTIAGGALASATYSVRADSAGAVECRASATGVDANEGTAVSTGTMSTGAITVRP